MFEKTVPNDIILAWQEIDENHLTTLAPLQQAISNYKKLDWSFLEQYLAHLFIHISLKENKGNCKKAEDFIRYGDVDLADVLPYYIASDSDTKVDILKPSTFPPKVSKDYYVVKPAFPVTVPPSPPTIITAKLFYGKRDRAIALLGNNNLERAESTNISEQNTSLSQAKVFVSIFGNEPPPPDDFDVYKILFEDLNYLEFMKFINNPTLLKKIVYPRP